MKKLLRKALKIVAIVLVLMLVVFGVLYVIYNQPLPQGQEGPKADAMAFKMLDAINYENYKKTRYLEWSFGNGRHQYKWDKKKGIVQVKWKDYIVDLNLDSPDKSDVFKNSNLINDGNSDGLIAKATAYFNNDSFWLVAPFKVFDEGTKRSLVILEDGSEGLLVTYTAGGTTPGDSYLWKLLPNGFPESFQMWTKIIPIGGLEATWDDWKVMKSGAFLPASHEFGPMTLHMGAVEGYN